MYLSFRPADELNRADILALKAAPGQEHFIETTAQCLDEADHLSNWVPVGLYDDCQLVGFAMFGFFPREGESGRVWLDRLLIDAGSQSRGYGKAAVRLLCEHLFDRYRCEMIFLSVYDDNPAAIQLYERIGFRFNGELDQNGERVMALNRLNFDLSE